MKNKKKKKSKLTPEKLQLKLDNFEAKQKNKKSKTFSKKVEKRAKKNKKKHEKIMKLVKPGFEHFGEDMVGFLAKSVVVNKKLMKRDADAIAQWRGEYYDILFNKIKKLIVEHNEKMQFDAEKLDADITKKRQKLDELRGEHIVLGEEVAKLKAEKGILENA
jgi:hypothetical protein